MKKIYLSGPITGLDYNQVAEAFENAAHEIRAMGFEPVSPMCNGVAIEAGWDSHMRADIKLLLDCEGIHMLPDWRNSRGAILEYQIAKALGIYEI